MSSGPVPVETYVDIVWKQFRKNRLAYLSLWSLAPLVLVAVFAPLVGSSQPLIYNEGGRRIYPWFRALFNADAQDMVFNMALLVSPLWLVLSVVQNFAWSRAGWKLRDRVGRAVAQYVLLTLLLYAACGGWQFEPTPWAPGETAQWLLNKLHLAAMPWLAAVLMQIPLWRRVGLSLPARMLLAGAQFLGLLAALCLVFSGRSLPPGLVAGFNGQFLRTVLLLAVVPWLVSLVPLHGACRSLNLGRARRAGLAALSLAIVALAFALAWVGPLWKPNNQFGSRDFSIEDFAAFKSMAAQKGVYAPVPFGPIRQDLSMTFQPPLSRKPAAQWNDLSDRSAHLLGTDEVGRDVLVRMLYGTRISITVGFVAVGIYLTIGCILGAIAGYAGGWVDMLINRVIEVVVVFPSFFLILTLVAMFRPNIYLIMIVIGVTNWTGIARLIRGEVLKQRSSDYVTAGRALGLSNVRIVFQHILPNSLSPALVAAPFGVAGAIITEASLSLLGFGVPAPTPTWGALLKVGSEKYDYWWLVLFPSLAIFVTVTLFNLIGSGLRDAMDPKLRSTR